MTALVKLFRTTAFKLLAAYLAVFMLFSGGVLAYVAWNAGRLLNAQISETIEAEVNGLAEQYRQGGIPRLNEIIVRRARQPGAFLYVLMGPRGEMISGNAVGLPPGTIETAGWHETSYLRAEEPAAGRRPARARVFFPPGNFRLLVGRDVSERDELRDVIRRAMVWSLTLVMILGALGTVFIARRVLKRVDAMTETAQSIMAGNLAGRLPVAGTNDELDRLASNLNAMLARIGELMTGLREVSDNIAHDLKTPLTRLRNGAEGALRTAGTAEEYRAALERMIEESDGLIRTFNALLMIARAESGTVSDTRARFDVSAAAADVAELFQPVAEEAGLALETAIAPGIAISGNRELFSQALTNLVDNAIKHGAPAPGSPPAQILLSVQALGGQIEVSVGDSGAGVPPADRERVLERFVRLDASRSKPGSGLGLSLAAAIARFHGGMLRLADNKPGLKAVMLLPAAPAMPN